MFTASDVVNAAIAEGVDTFTLSAVAERLGVATPAVYRLYRSRDDIVVAALDLIASSFRLPDEGASWREVLRLWADETWRICETYKGINRVVYSNPTAFTHIEDVIGAYADALGTSGKTPGQALFALDFIGDTVMASHLGVETMRAVDATNTTGLERARAGTSDDAVMKPDEEWTDGAFMNAKVEFLIAALGHDWPEAPTAG